MEKMALLSHKMQVCDGAVGTFSGPTEVTLVFLLRAQPISAVINWSPVQAQLSYTDTDFGSSSAAGRWGFRL